jgi:hypothetical protein
VNFRIIRLPGAAGAVLVTSLLGLVLGCTEDPAGVSGSPGTGTRIAGEVQSDPAQFATPTPKAPPTSPFEEDTAMATPTPAPLPFASPAPTPTPTPATNTSASPSASPAPDADRYTKTSVATDIAVSGPGYMVLSTKADPTTVEDLLFTKNGHFEVEKDTTGQVAVFRLRHGDHKFHVVGFTKSGTKDVGAPGETSGTGAALLTSEWGGTVKAAGLALDADRNPDTVSKLSFDYTGKLRLAEVDPRAGDGGGLQAFVGLATFEKPAELVDQPGFEGDYQYRQEAGAIALGVAVTGAGRTVGNANLILTGTLEKGD